MVNKVRGSVIDLPLISDTIPTTTASPAGSVVFNSVNDTPVGWRYTEGEWKPFGSTYLETLHTWDPPSITAGSYTSFTHAIAGAKLGDHVLVSFSLDITGGLLHGFVSSAGNVTVVLQNISGTTLNLSSGNLRIRVERR